MEGAMLYIVWKLLTNATKYTFGGPILYPLHVGPAIHERVDGEGAPTIFMLTIRIVLLNFELL